MGTEWGLGPFTLEHTTERRHVDPPLGGEQESEGDSYLATGSRLGHRAAIRGRAGATVHDASGTSDQDGPEPGHLTTKARSERTEAGASARTASERDRSADEKRGDPRGSPVPEWPKGSSAGPSKDAVRAARREVSTGTN